MQLTLLEAMLAAGSTSSSSPRRPRCTAILNALRSKRNDPLGPTTLWRVEIAGRAPCCVVPSIQRAALRLLAIFQCRGRVCRTKERRPSGNASHPRILEVALARGKDVQIFGTDYPTPDGTCVARLHHVSDLGARICWRCTASRMKRRSRSPRIYNSATGNGFSVRQAGRVARKVTRHPLTCCGVAAPRGRSSGTDCKFGEDPARVGVDSEIHRLAIDRRKRMARASCASGRLPGESRARALTMTFSQLNSQPHRRLNPLTGDGSWFLRTAPERPVARTGERVLESAVTAYDPKCYLCPATNGRGDSEILLIPKTFVFDNDFCALKPDTAACECRNGVCW